MGQIIGPSAQQIIAQIVGGAPETLNTLNEIAAAIDDDGSYAVSVQNALDSKASLTGAQTLSDKTLQNPTITRFVAENFTNYSSTTAFSDPWFNADNDTLPQPTFKYYQGGVSNSLYISMPGNFTASYLYVGIISPNTSPINTPNATLLGGPPAGMPGVVIGYDSKNNLTNITLGINSFGQPYNTALADGSTLVFKFYNGSPQAGGLALSKAFSYMAGVNISVSTTELSYLDGVTSSIQNQLNNAPQFPSQANQYGKFLQTDGANVSWENIPQAASTVRGIVYGHTELSNAAVGYQSFESNSGSAFNTAVGGNSLRFTTSGSENTAVGFTSGQLINTGYGNSLFGVDAGGNITTGYNNTLIGKYAGGIETGFNNIVIGANAATTATNSSNQVVIGDSGITRFRIPGMEIDWNYVLSEKATVSNTSATGTINYDLVTNRSILYYTANSGGNWTLNVRGNSSTTLNSIMSTGQSITIAFLVTNGATGNYQTAFQIDGSAVSPKWQGGSAPTSGNANSIDIYSITIIKTGNAAFTALESQTRFA